MLVLLEHSVDNGDGTFQFTMKALNAGDKVTIGGKEYTIGGTADDVTKLLTDGNVTDTANAKVTINGTEFTYYESAADRKTELTKNVASQPDAADATTASPAHANVAAIKALTKRDYFCWREICYTYGRC